ncbi:PAWR protein, partial [Corythaeola cristata]|nr:PAWR protein [Corythaeola cristata]
PPPAAAPGSPEGEEKLATKGKSSGPSARKGKGQIEKRKLREKRRSTGVVNIPAAESLDEYEDDEAGQKERKKEDAITQQNTIQNESSSADTPGSYLLQRGRMLFCENLCGPRRSLLSVFVQGREGRHLSAVVSKLSRDLYSSAEIDIAIELAKERQENARLMKMTQDKEELIGKLKEEIDLLNR